MICPRNQPQWKTGTKKSQRNVQILKFRITNGKNEFLWILQSALNLHRLWPVMNQLAGQFSFVGFFLSFFFLFNSMPNVGLAPTTPRSRVSCSTDWTSQIPHFVGFSNGSQVHICSRKKCKDWEVIQTRQILRRDLKNQLSGLVLSLRWEWDH